MLKNHTMERGEGSSGYRRRGSASESRSKCEASRGGGRVEETESAARRERARLFKRLSAAAVQTASGIGAEAGVLKLDPTTEAARGACVCEAGTGLGAGTADWGRPQGCQSVGVESVLGRWGLV